MPNEFGRHLRVGESIKRELAPVVQRLASDRGQGLVTVTGVEVAPDLREAKIYVSCLAENADELVAALNQSIGQLRYHLSRHVRLRRTPQLRVLYDESLARGARLCALIGSLEDLQHAGER